MIHSQGPTGVIFWFALPERANSQSLLACQTFDPDFSRKFCCDKYWENAATSIGKILQNIPPQLISSLFKARAFPHHYQGRIDFNTVNPCHSQGMELVSIPAGRAVLANPVPRAKIFQCSPCREMNSHPRAMNM